MRIFGIDPAPGKGTTIFDEEKGTQKIEVAGLRDHLNYLRRKSANVLLCWDAPLTGPSDPTRPGTELGDFTIRGIEWYFRSRKCGWKAPVAVLPYAQCQHWAISRALLGLPRVGPYDRRADRLPFRLCVDKEPPRKGHNVVEVHPGLAIWIWLRSAKVKDADRIAASYKDMSNTAIRRRIMARIAGVSDHLATVAKSFPAGETVATDDALDAFVAYSLGWLWVNDPEKVMLLGDARTGALLLPRDSSLKVNFALSNLVPSRLRRPLTRKEQVEARRQLRKMGYTDRRVFGKRGPGRRVR